MMQLCALPARGELLRWAQASQPMVQGSQGSPVSISDNEDSLVRGTSSSGTVLGSSAPNVSFIAFVSLPVAASALSSAALQHGKH